MVKLIKYNLITLLPAVTSTDQHIRYPLFTRSTIKTSQVI